MRRRWQVTCWMDAGDSINRDWTRGARREFFTHWGARRWADSMEKQRVVQAIVLMRRATIEKRAR